MLFPPLKALNFFTLMYIYFKYDQPFNTQSDEKSLNAHVTMSRIRRSQGQHSEAVSVLKKALKFHPSKKTLINSLLFSFFFRFFSISHSVFIFQLVFFQLVLKFHLCFSVFSL